MKNITIGYIDPFVPQISFSIGPLFALRSAMDYGVAFPFFIPYTRPSNVNLGVSNCWFGGAVLFNTLVNRVGIRFCSEAAVGYVGCFFISMFRVAK